MQEKIDGMSEGMLGWSVTVGPAGITKGTHIPQQLLSPTTFSPLLLPLPTSQGRQHLAPITILEHLTVSLNAALYPSTPLFHLPLPPHPSTSSLLSIFAHPQCLYRPFRHQSRKTLCYQTLMSPKSN